MLIEEYEDQWCLLVLMEIKMHRRWWKGILWLRKAHQERTLTHLFQYHNICISLAKCFLLAVFHVDLCYSSFQCLDLYWRQVLGFQNALWDSTIFIQIILPLAASILHTAVGPLELQKMNAVVIYLVWMKIGFVNPQIIYFNLSFSELFI